MNEQTQEALKMAIETMEATKLGDIALGVSRSIELDATILACKEALAQPQPKLFLDLSNSNGNHPVQQEPVAVVETIGGYPDESVHTVKWLVKYKDLKDGDKLYTHPAQEPVAYEPTSQEQSVMHKAMIRSSKLVHKAHPAPSWQGLNDDEKLEIIRKWKDAHTMREQELIGLGDAIEQALKEKNT